MNRYTDKDKEIANRAVLYDYLLAYHKDEYVIYEEQGRLVSKKKSYWVVTKKCNGAYCNKPKQYFSSIDFLIKYYNLTLPEAIFKLRDFQLEVEKQTDDENNSSVSSNSINNQTAVPEKAKMPADISAKFKTLKESEKLKIARDYTIKFLSERNISESVIEDLLESGIIVPSYVQRNDTVFLNTEFVSRNTDFREIYSSINPESFHITKGIDKKEGYWEINCTPDSTHIFIVNDVIKALYTYCVVLSDKPGGNIGLISISNYNDKTIEKICNDFKNITHISLNMNIESPVFSVNIPKNIEFTYKPVKSPKSL